MLVATGIILPRFLTLQDSTRGVLSLIVLALAVVCNYFLSAQRLRDLNVTGWLSLFWVPIGMLPDPFSSVGSIIFLICLCAIPGTRGENSFGPDPLA